MSELAKKLQQNIEEIKKRIKKMKLDKQKVKVVLQNNNLTFDTPAEKNQFFEAIKKDEDKTKKKLQALEKEEKTLTKAAKKFKSTSTSTKRSRRQETQTTRKKCYNDIYKTISRKIQTRI